MFACLGFQALGVCHYDPNQPSLSYFTLGDAVAALGFTLAVQQLLKPIYVFRLRAYGLQISYILAPVFIGFAFTLIATLLPNVPHVSDGPLTYPVVWETMGAILIGAAYGAASWVAFRRAKIHTFNLKPFVRAAAHFLSSAADEDRVSFAEDLLTEKNLSRLFTYTTALERARHHEMMLEFDRLRAEGKEQSIRGDPPISPFYRFTHRQELEQAAFAGTFLRIMSDQDMCSALVRKAPWLTSRVLQGLSEKKLFTEQARPFVQELAYQAILQDESLLTKEIGYSGFNAVPLLLDSLFGNIFIVRNFHPLDRIDFEIPDPPSKGFIKRLNRASEMMVQTALSHREFWPQGYIYSLQRHYETLFSYWYLARWRKQSAPFAFELHFGVQKLYQAVLAAPIETTHTPIHLYYKTDAKTLAVA